MDDPISRWSRLVRSPGTVRLHGSHQTTVPALGDGLTDPAARPGIRLQVHPIATSTPVYLLDVTSSAVQAMLEGFLRSGVATGKFLSWESRGFGARRRDTLHIRPGPGRQKA
ncbi:MAG TPA: hypothetical protein VKH81_03835 [Candidatus Angelobacter sp.]|nr:hypothetical protein [Candidatus Angelobacter sp.]